MPTIKELTHLATLISKFEKLDASLFDQLETRNLAFIEETLEAKKNVKRYLSELKPINVAPDLAIKIKKIRDNYGYDIDTFLESLLHVTGRSVSQESEEEIDFVDALFSEGTADYVDQNFFRRRNEVGTLVVSYSFPENFARHFEEVRECFALGLFEATVIYCRAVIEVGCFETLRRRGKISSATDDIRSLQYLMREVKSFAYQPNWDAAAEVITKANQILHSKRKVVAIGEEEAFSAIKDTIAIVEDLFANRWRGGKS